MDGRQPKNIEKNKIPNKINLLEKHVILFKTDVSEDLLSFFKNDFIINLFYSEFYFFIILGQPSINSPMLYYNIDISTYVFKIILI